MNKFIEEVSFLIASMMRDRFIYMPRTLDEIHNSKVEFMRWANFPLCVGAVDGTHILVQSFGGEDAEHYRNRKTTFSLNCQLIVSADV